MKRIYVTTIGRGKDLSIANAVHCLDFEQKMVVGRSFVPGSNKSLANCRGGTRGARGLVFVPNGNSGDLWVAGYDGLFRFTEDLRLTEGFWIDDAKAKDFHGIYKCCGSSRLCLTSTYSDRVVYWNYDNHTLSSVDAVYSSSRGHVTDKERPLDKLHLNACVLGPDDFPRFVLFNRTGEIYDQRGSGESLGLSLLLSDAKGAHDLIFLKDPSRLILNDSKNSKVLSFPYEESSNSFGEGSVVFTFPGEKIVTTARSGWLRGLKYIPEWDILLVGSSPAGIFCLEKFSSGNPEISEIVISTDLEDSVFGVEINSHDWMRS